MDEPSPDILTTLFSSIAIAMVLGGIAIWLTVLRRVLLRQPVIEFERRRPVPWNGWEVIAIFLAFYLLASLLATGAELALGWNFDPQLEAATQTSSAEEAGADKTDLDRAHPIIVLLDSNLSRGVIALCLLSAVILAPVHEEFVFRLVIQGYLEKVELRRRRMFHSASLWLGIWPIALSSLIFAALHFRFPRPLQPEQVLYALAIGAVVRILLVIGGVAYLKTVRSATWADLGIRFDTFFTDLRLALTAFVAIIVPINALQYELVRRFPDFVPDPIPLTILAVALGYLYFRTQRLMPALLLHLMFNAASMALFFASMSMK